MKSFVGIMVSIVVLFPVAIFAYDDNKVHPEINKHAAMQSVLSLGSVLYDLGFTDGLDENLQGINKRLSIKDWISKGGTDEDGTSAYKFFDLLEFRYIRHFHDPLKSSWDSAGLTLTWPDSKSNLLWAQDSGQDFSWLSARNHYYQALTTGDEQAFSSTFKTLGHLMHLVADMAVPAHVRDDAHPLGTSWFIPKTWRGDFYEEWAKLNFDDPKLITYTILPVNQSIVVDTSIFTRANPESTDEEDLAPVPITAIWDQNVYDGSNPEVTRSPDLSIIGLAEYTNANFFSQDTIFKDYNYPSRDTTLISESAWLDPEPVFAEDNGEDNRVYVWGNAGGSGGYTRLAAVSLFSRDCMNKGYPPPMQLDETTHQDYASHLIPRAVGYSAALLDYFFRGKIEISQPLDGAYSVSTDPSQGFTTIKLSASNTSPVGEDLVNGPIKLVVKFKTALNNTFEGEMPVFDANAGFTYLVADEANSITSIFRTTDTGSPTLLTFNLPSNIPLSATDLQLYLVYKGALGNETGGIAVGYKDIGEPTAFDVINSMDWVCINNAWYQTGLDAHILSDRDNNGFPDFDAFPHHISSLNISLTSADTTAAPNETTRDLHYENLATGSIARNYVLVDQKFTVNYGNLFYTPDMAEDTMWDHSQPMNGSFPDPLTAVSIQKNPTDGTYTNDGWEPFRGITTHNALTIMMGEDTCNYDSPSLPSLMFTPSINQQ